MRCQPSFVSLSNVGLCRSSIFTPKNSSNSAIEPNTLYSPSFSHIGSGVPQKRFLEIDQGRAPSIQDAKRLPADVQFTFLLFSIKASRIFGTSTYQESVAR